MVKWNSSVSAMGTVGQLAVKSEKFAGLVITVLWGKEQVNLLTCI